MNTHGEMTWGVDQSDGQVAVYLVRSDDKVCPAVLLDPAAATALGDALRREAMKIAEAGAPQGTK
jgi:hypothetical protein